MNPDPVREPKVTEGCDSFDFRSRAAARIHPGPTAPSPGRRVVNRRIAATLNSTRSGPDPLKLGPRVMVVDDDKHVRDALDRWLTRAGYLVTKADGLTEAMSLLSGATPHALVIDVRLRDFNGFQLALHARRQDPHASIVMISGWDDPVLRREAEACGAKYLCKPFSADALLAVLADVTRPSPLTPTPS
jgi:CheY-like chemotaxis protein